MSENTYERFRTVLSLNLCTVIQDPEILQNVLNMVDITMADYDVVKKPLEIITAETVTKDLVKCFIASKAVANCSQGTLKQYRYKLEHFCANMTKAYQDITANDIRTYLFRFRAERHASDSYMDSIRLTLNNFFQWLVDNDYLTRNPCAKVEQIHFKAKPREPLTALQLEIVRSGTRDIREKALVDFLFSTGCRVSECADLRRQDINFDDRSVFIRCGKGGKSRTVYFNAESELSLKQYLATRKDGGDGLFVSVKAPHAPLGKGGLEGIIRKISRRTDLHVFPHRLRHTFATMGLRGGMSIEHLQQLLGHASPDTTLIYAKEDQTRVRMEHRRVYT